MILLSVVTFLYLRALAPLLAFLCGFIVPEYAVVVIAVSLRRLAAEMCEMNTVVFLFQSINVSLRPFAWSFGL
jgi:hypothetical protein